MLANVSSKLINLITPQENTSSYKDYLSSGQFQIKIALGCDGIEAMIILLAAILAFPAGIKSKLYGITGGFLVLYAANLLRIVGLYYTLKYKPSLFNFMHILVGQTIIILIAFFFFIVWLNIQMNNNGEKTSAT